MITRFEQDTALLLIDVQKGVDDLVHWGGPGGRRNNPDAEAKALALLTAWRARGLPVFWTLHNSREPRSPLRIGTTGGEFKDGFMPAAGEPVAIKDVNSGFTGTSLELDLRRWGVRRLVVCGFFTNFCVETTVRAAGNMAFDTYLVEDACATSNRIGLDGADHPPELVHAIAVASMNGEFCTAISCESALSLIEQDAARLRRVQGNEVAMLMSPAERIAA